MGHSIDSVSGCNGSLSGNTYTTGAITADCTVTASFQKNFYPLYVKKYGTGSGTVTSSLGDINCGDTCSASFLFGHSVTLTATPESGTESVFMEWWGNCSGKENPLTITIMGETNCIARFKEGSILGPVYHLLLN